MQSKYFLVPSILIAFIALQSLGLQNYTPEQARAIINETTSFVNTINESGYIIFYPRLSGAYSYLANATKIYNTSPDLAVAFSIKAREIAIEEENRIESYAYIAFIAMLIFTLSMLSLLYIYMKPVKKARKGVIH